MPKKNIVIQITICVIIVLAWEYVGRNSSTAFFFVGTPTAVFLELSQLVFLENFHMHFMVTGSEAVLGLVIGTIVGATVGLSLWYWESLAEVARPFAIGMGTLPILAFAPLMIVWFGIGFWMKVALATFSTVFVAFDQALRGASFISQSHVDVLKGMNASRLQIFFKIVIPGSLNWILSSMRLNVGFGLLGAFIGEFIAADRGLGYLILRAGGLYNTPRAMAAAIGITILALMLNQIADYIEKHRLALIQLLSVPNIIWK